MSDQTYAILNVSANRGYAADQAESRMTLGDLLAAVENAIGDFGEDAIVVTHDKDNRYGASWGKISAYETFAFGDDDEEDY
ncbi:hypothetical protein PP304_gp123 [Gordonia phage Phendrix]|uniref:Uncharacterized protein n=1 Tax=Gordonia phage Phendrix TaxID=2593335 RepID=A0A514U1E9_9CAUD|nr:hypothetical protein PP304_gp014 [Gordonia phage Phendrix]YP_010649244.1 hypothetical protein PP304_gp123 [Gordonia phage Phendrix]QDK02562.1 hypothetical protein SEA_PHENDRIX_14 [Gordonia phage Phendrix]QDK02746.1 hypothetical protein SEA_PHENDRIX_230 [Gordonia phage Phendrix]